MNVRRLHYIVVVDLFLLALCAAGVYRAAQKAGFPVALESRGGTAVVAGGADGAFQPGDTVVALAGQRVGSADEVVFLCNEYNIGDPVQASLTRGGNAISVRAFLVPYYTARYVVIQVIAGAIFFGVGFFVAVRKHGDAAALIFHHLCAAIALTILLTTGCFTIPPFGAGHALEIIFIAAYLLTPALFVHFTLVFPRENFRSVKRIIAPIYGVAFALFAWSGAAFLLAAYPSARLEYFAGYDVSTNAVRIFFTVLFFAGLWLVVRSYRAAPEETERRTLRLILFGVAAGVFAFIFLWQIPQIVMGKGLVDEEYVIALSAIAPITFAIAIVRYRLFDIDRFIKRSTVYTITTGTLLVVYLAFIGFLSHTVRAYRESFMMFDVAGALLIALLFEPMRRRMQKIVDVRFFRVRYDLQAAQRKIFEGIKSAGTTKQLAAAVVAEANVLVPVARIGFFVVKPPNDRLQLAAHRGFDILERHAVRLEKEQLKTNLELPVAVRGAVEPGVPCEAADENVFRRWGMALALPIHSGGRELLGFLVLGAKLAGTVFTAEDVSLLESVSARSGLALERMTLESNLALEHAESERLDELNRLKSYFVSSVSHDLKTPLTSIRLFAELLQTAENLPREKVMEYLAIIEGEADRLSRLITNVLDFAQIENGTKTYSFAPAELNEIVRNTLRAIEYQMRSSGCALSAQYRHEPLPISADAGAITNAITNLLTNAMKYSPADRKCIVVATACTDGYATVSVQDAGHGIAQEEIESIFEAFYRLDNPASKSAGGVGIGLSVVKRTMDAHNGRVTVQSKPGNGSTFTLHFPLAQA